MPKNNKYVAAEFKPEKSAVFTLGSFLIAAALMCGGVTYVSEGKLLAGLMLFFPGMGAAIASYILGFRSSRDQDLGVGYPFKISANEDSFELNADSRTSQDVMLSLISTTAQTLRDRRPLPAASGIVVGGMGDSSREGEANQLVRSINCQVENDLNSLADALTVRQKIDPLIVASAPKGVKGEGV